MIQYKYYFINEFAIFSGLLSMSIIGFIAGLFFERATFFKGEYKLFRNMAMTYDKKAKRWRWRYNGQYIMKGKD